MRLALRKLTVLAAMLSLLAGVWLPGDGGAFTDADGICGPVLALARAGTIVGQDHAQSAQTPHCLFCHWRHTMASASAVAFVAIPGPLDVGRVPAGAVSIDPSVAEIGNAAPRGPPATS